MPRISYDDAVSGVEGRLNRADAARYLGVKTKTLASYHLTGVGPASHKMAGQRFYYVRDLRDYVRSKSEFKNDRL